MRYPARLLIREPNAQTNFVLFIKSSTYGIFNPLISITYCAGSSSGEISTSLIIHFGYAEVPSYSQCIRTDSPTGAVMFSGCFVILIAPTACIRNKQGTIEMK